MLLLEAHIKVNDPEYDGSGPTSSRSEFSLDGLPEGTFDDLYEVANQLGAVQKADPDGRR